eukprot:SAG31_NODE_568_length_14006_cov_4.252119_10_plen_36_part_00
MHDTVLELEVAMVSKVYKVFLTSTQIWQCAILRIL